MITEVPLKSTADTYPMVRVGDQCLSIETSNLFFGEGLGAQINHGFISHDNCSFQPVLDDTGKLKSLLVIANCRMGNNTQLFINWGAGEIAPVYSLWTGKYTYTS